MKTILKPHLMSRIGVLLDEWVGLLCCRGPDWVAMG